MFGFTSVFVKTNRDGADAESLSASFKNSRPREKVGNLSSFCEYWAESLFVSTIVEKYIIFPELTMASRAKKNFWRSDFLTPSASTIEILSTLTYTEFDCVALLAML